MGFFAVVKMKAIFVTLALCAAAVLAHHDPYTVMNDPGNFTIDTVTMTTSTGHWTAGAIATVTITGTCKKHIVAGTVKYQIYEAFVPSFVAQDNFAYFKCTNKGCDPTQPVSLYLASTTSIPTRYRLKFQFQMVGAQKTGDFRLVIYGQDQDHFPYDFSSTIGYNFTRSTPEPQLSTPTTRLSAPMSDPIDVMVQNGNFTVNSVRMVTPNGHWQPGATATVVMIGVTKKVIIAGTVKWQVYESFVPSFTDQGDRAYFQCTNKGCDSSKPIALNLAEPGKVDSTFTLSFSFKMGDAKKTGDFRLVIFGQDQDHYPYDFSVTVGYNYTNNAAALMMPPPPAPVAAVSTDPYSVLNDPGNFTVSSVKFSTPTGHWTAGQNATVTIKGISKKVILAGTVKWQIYESYVKSFVGQGFSSYFTCTNKGCDPSKPIALTLEDPTSKNSDYTLTFQYTMPKKQISGEFRLVIYGQDQDHFPYDFSSTITYKYA